MGRSWNRTLNGKCSHNQKNISSCDNAGQERERGTLFLQRTRGCWSQAALGTRALSESAGLWALVSVDGGGAVGGPGSGPGFVTDLFELKAA